MLTESFFRVVFLNLFVKFCAMCRIQNTCTQLPSVQSLLGLLNAALIELWWSDIKYKFCWGITCLLRVLRKKKQVSVWHWMACWRSSSFLTKRNSPMPSSTNSGGTWYHKWLSGGSNGPIKWLLIMMHIWLRVTPFGILHKENLLSSKSIATLKDLYAFNSSQKTIFTYCTIKLHNFQTKEPQS